MNHWTTKLRLRLPAILLLAATLFFWTLYDRYEPVAPALLDAPALADADRTRGACTETNGVFALTVPASGKTARINFSIPGAETHPCLRVRGRIKTDGVGRGKYPWSQARLLLLQYDQNNKWIPGTHNVIARDGTVDWESNEVVFEILPETARVEISLQQIGTSGTAWFDGIAVQPVRTRASFGWWRIAFAGLWIFMAALYFPRCRLNKRKLRILILLNALAILAGALMPGKWIEDSSNQFRQTIAKTAKEPSPAKTPEHDVKRIDRFNDVVGGTHRIGHFGLFASLCFLVYCSAALERQHRSYYFKVVFDMLLFAAVTEALQFLTLDRSAGLRDMLTDAAGMTTGLLLFLLCYKALPRAFWFQYRKINRNTARHQI